jgi:Ca2+-binding RTX toxin-like protein
VDRVRDFVVADDTIFLDADIFTRAGSAGTLEAEAFVVGARALEADDRVIYNPGTGALSYDPDGSGATGAVRFAQLARGLPLTFEDIVIV